MKRNTQILDKIGSLIPGYNGYKEREGRRNSDKILREKIAESLIAIENNLDNKIIELIQIRELKGVQKVEKFRKKINTISSKIKFSSYGVSSFFSDNQITENELEQIHQMDIKLEEITEILQVKVANNKLGEETEKIISEIKNIISTRNNFIKEYK